ncbi:MAG: preprotein translocase subunit SecE [Clostridia bacterium]|nr:preprotein translocase subunit SecE [Clostridia bacterium]
MPKDVTKKENKEKKEKKHFFKDFKAELKRVIWPTPKQLINNTVAVITIVLITAVIVFALDFIFKTMDDYGINKLRSFVDTNNEQVQNNTTNQEAQNTMNNALNNEATNNEQTNATSNSQVNNNTVNE